VKTTIELDDGLLRQAKSEAARTGVSLKSLIEDALRARLLPRPTRRQRFRLQVPVVEGSAPPAIDVADRDALYDLMERG
jgi:hypothetical protein